MIDVITRKAKHNVVPLFSTLAYQPLELIHIDYLQIEPSKWNIENVVVTTDHFTRYVQAYVNKT